MAGKNAGNDGQAREYFEKAISLGLKLGLIGFVFCESGEAEIFISLCINSTYVHFWPFCNWL